MVLALYGLDFARFTFCSLHNFRLQTYYGFKKRLVGNMDSLQLARRIHQNYSILLASQHSHLLKELIALLEHALTETEAENWVGERYAG